MGKRYKHLYDSICTFENLWQASRKARRGKRRKASAQTFEYDLEANLLVIQQDLLEECYTFGPYHTFTITEPKERLICAAPYRDRVVHHALCNVIEPLLDRAMIYDTYACRTGKGTHRALDRAQHYLRRYPWVLKLDIRKYFFTIDHDILLQKLQRKLYDQRLSQLLAQLLQTWQSPPDYYFPFPDDTLFDAIRPRGLPIGNLTSQLFANYYLNDLDRYIKETLKIPAYVRYMDDGLLFGNSKAQVQATQRAVTDFLKTLRLQAHPRKTQCFPAQNGVPFLGFHLYPYYRRILRPNLQRFKRRMGYQRKAYRQGTLAWDRLLLSLNAWLGYAGKETHKALLNTLFEKHPYQHPTGGKSWTFWLP